MDGVTANQLSGGFFVGLPNPPSAHTHLEILVNSTTVVSARIEDETVIGFITAVSDGVSCAYIPHLEVLPAYQGHGIGTALVQQMLAKLRHLYMIDLVCDPSVQPFYERLGMRPVVGIVVRNYDRQSCDPMMPGQASWPEESWMPLQKAVFWFQAGSVKVAVSYAAYGSWLGIRVTAG